MIGDASFLSMTETADAWNRRLRDPHWLATARAMDEVVPLVGQAERRAREGSWVVLALAYEAAPAFDPYLSVRAPEPDLPLVFAAAYAAAVQTPPETGAPDEAAFATTPWQATVSRPDYDRALADIRDNIRRGEVYQVNHTIALHSRFSGDPAACFATLAREQGAGYNAHIDMGRQHLLSFSPELFFARRGAVVTVRPMKGTMPRGRTPEEDASRAAALAECPKNRAENRMITDLLRNDLGRIARPGSVRVPELFAVERLATAWQMTSTVTAEVPPSVGLTGLLTALFPCGSITGAPKRSAMDIIRRLEDGPRGFYTGAIGHLAPGGDAVFSVAIRTVRLDTQTGLCRFGVGGGITHDSTAPDEYEECRIKAAFLSRRATPFALLETLRLANGRFALLPEHLARLAGSAAYHGFRHDPAAIDTALAAVAKAHPHGRFRVRLLVSRDGMARTEVFALARRTQAPLRLCLAAKPVNAADPALFHKTTRRAFYDRTLKSHPGYDDVLLQNTRGEVTESCRANLVAALDGRLLTPALGCGLLPGTYRARLLARGVIAEAVLTPDDLARASRLWLLNSVRLWMPAVLDQTPHAQATLSDTP